MAVDTALMKAVAHYGLYLFIHHISSMHIIFADGILDPHARDASRAELRASCELFEAIIQTPKPVQFAAAVRKSLGVVKVLLDVSYRRFQRTLAGYQAYNLGTRHNATRGEV